MSRLSLDEQYEERLTAEARAQHAAIMAALKAGEPNNTAVIVNALNEYLIDINALAELVRKTAAGENYGQKVLNDLVWTEAEARARAELARQERAGRQADAEARAERAAAVRHLERVLV